MEVTDMEVMGTKLEVQAFLLIRGPGLQWMLSMEVAMQRVMEYLGHGRSQSRCSLSIRDISEECCKIR